MNETANNSSGQISTNNGDVLTVCVVTPYPPAPSETFIRAHVENLPARVVLVHGWRPTIGERPVLSLPARVMHKAWRTLSRSDLSRETTAAYAKAFRRERVSVVLAEYGPTGVAVMEACRRTDVPLVVHFHGFDASVRDVLAEHAENYRKMFHEAAAIVAVSRAMQRRLAALGAPPAKLHYNPYGIDCRAFGGANPSDAPPVFVAVGRFVEKKAPHLTLAAFAEVYKACAEARLRMVGDGPMLDQCRQLARELGIEEAVTFLGAQPPAVVQEEMRGARCFVQHSVEAPNGDCEGTPVGILEAGASGLPVVSTRHAGIPDAVVEGQTGFLVDEGDAATMSAHLLRLAREPELAGRMGRAARQHIQSNFEKRQSLGRLWSIMQASAVGNQGSGVGSQLSVVS